MAMQKLGRGTSLAGVGAIDGSQFYRWPIAGNKPRPIVRRTQLATATVAMVFGE